MVEAMISDGDVDVTVLRVAANGLEHRVLEWNPSGAAEARTVVLVHGYMDAAGTWDRVAPMLAAAGHRVLAPDMRGFGDGARVASGGYYHFVDYVFDLADLVDALCSSAPVALVGHSMGGTIATYFAGAFPERVSALANLEGLGPPDNPFEVGPVRVRRWIDDVRALRRRAGGVESPLSRAEALRRLAANHPNVPHDVLESRLGHLVVEREHGELAWKTDPLHRTTSPVPFFASLFRSFAANVTCPVLFVSGGPEGFHVPDEDERLRAFGRVERAELTGAGHMMHWTKPEALATRLATFLG